MSSSKTKLRAKLNNENDRQIFNGTQNRLPCFNMYFLCRFLIKKISIPVILSIFLKVFLSQNQLMVNGILQMTADKMFCRKCGKELLDTDIFCSKCGTRLVPSAEAIATKIKSKKLFLSKTMMLGIIGILVLGIFVFIIGVTVHPNQNVANNTPAMNSKLASTTTLKDSTIATVYTIDKIKAKNYQLSKVINNDFSEWACESYGTQLGTYTALSGYTYICALIAIKNNGFNSISMNPYSWKLTADNVSYSPDTATFSLKQPLSQVEHGDEAGLSIVYLVQGNPQTACLTYIG